jgi:hypothetical protein
VDEPAESSRIDLVATLEDNDLVIKHMGGEALDTEFTTINIGIGFAVEEELGLVHGGVDRTWSIGEEWRRDITTHLNNASAFNQRLFVQVIDTDKNAIILDQVLRKGPGTGSFPDIGIQPESLIFSDNNPEHNTFIQINVTIVNYGPVNVSNINVRFFDQKTFIGANNTITHLNHTGLTENSTKVTLRWKTNYIGRHVISVKVVPKINETNLENNYLSKILLVGQGVNPDLIAPNLVLTKISFGKENPKSKETVVVTYEVANTAKIAATGFTLEVGEVFEGTNTSLTNITVSETVTYQVPVEVKYEWIPQKGGTHFVWGRIHTVLPSGEDPSIENTPLDRDFLGTDIEVMPTVLLVDDDKAGKGSLRDTVTYMRDAIKAVGISPDIVVVGGGDGPQYTGTGMTLDDYDLVIWMCGYEGTNTITTTGPTNDVDNLEAFLDDGGYLWVIGQDIVNDLRGSLKGQGFLANYLHVNGQTLDVAMTSTVIGSTDTEVTDGLLFDTTIPSGITATPDIIVPDGGSYYAMDNSSGGNMSLLNNASSYRVGFFTFEFAHIKKHSDRAILTYRMLKWFNATVAFEGKDVAVSEVVISPPNPHFKQKVAVTAYIRNNGRDPMTGVKVIFKDIYMGIERVIDPDPADTPDTNNPMSVDLDGLGGTNITIKHWVPEDIGMHAIKVVVDPNDVIKEINEENNEFQSILSPTDVFVDSITLIVDDDQAVSGVQNTTDEVKMAMDSLNYRYDLYNVSAGGDGPNIDNLTKYNTVIWVFGDQSASTLTASDRSNLTSFLTGYSGNLLLIGQNLLEDNAVWTDTNFRQGILGINTVNTGVGISDPLEGISDHNISHGMLFETNPTFADDADAIQPNGGDGSEGVFLEAGGDYYAISFQNTSGVDYRVVTMTAEFAFIQNSNDRDELMYMIQHWFGQVDKRIELRVTWDDLFFGQDNGPTIEFEDMNPVLGDSYILQAKIWNVGGTPGGAVVRFVDGTTVINSANVYVPASTTDADGNIVPGSGIAEVIWTPLFAGNRPITVKVDPDMNIPITGDPHDTTGEVFKANNNATRTIEVYFFYDDMETGGGNWMHDATILHINGEQPIEYFDRLRPVDTNIIDDYDWGISSGWDKFLTDGHTLPSSYKMTEPLNTNLTQAFDLKVAMCIDDSGSMAWNDPTDLRLDAANNFVKNILSDGDQIGVYLFEGHWDYLNDVWWWNRAFIDNLYFRFDSGNTSNFESYPFNNTTKKYLNSSFEAPWDTSPLGNAYFDSIGGTPFYRCVRAAVAALNAWSSPNEYPVVIGLTDGANNWAPSFSQYLPEARGTGVPLYMVGLGGGVVEEELFDVAEVSNGGQYFFASSADVLNDTFQRIGDSIGGGGSRGIPSDTASSRDEQVGPPEENDASGGTSSRWMRYLYLLNPIGGEKWGSGINRNVTWACRADVQSACGQATLQISIDGGGWTNIATNVGTRVDLNGNPADHERMWYKRLAPDAGWYPRWLGGWVEVYSYNWSIPDVTSSNVMLRVQVTQGNSMTSNSAAFEIFDQGITLGGGGGATMVNELVTEEFQLINYEKATLSFWQRYDLLYTENGGVVQIGTSINSGGPYAYEYVDPTQPYTGNLRLDKTVNDDYGNEIRWAWNGRSGGGTFNWEHVVVDLTDHINPARPWVKVKLVFYTWGFGNGGSWWVDDMKVKVQRSDTVAIVNSHDDQWELFEWNSAVDPAAHQPHSGTFMWWNHDPTRGHDAKSGIDNSLYTKSIDLTNAKDAHLSTYFMFNYDDDAGRPPDGFRVEISADNGVTWKPVNLGVRSSWGVSGNWVVDGKSPSGTQAYTGIQDGGANSATPVWVSSDSLWRLNTDISGWAGSVIKIRFRVVTNLDATHYESNTVFKGLAIDDVIVRGNTTISGAPLMDTDDLGYDEVQPGADTSKDVLTGPNGLVENIKSSIGLSSKMKATDQESG